MPKKTKRIRKAQIVTQVDPRTKVYFEKIATKEGRSLSAVAGRALNNMVLP